jgi:hypothetical protein
LPSQSKYWRTPQTDIKPPEAITAAARNRGVNKFRNHFRTIIREKKDEVYQFNFKRDSDITFSEQNVKR